MTTTTLAAYRRPMFTAEDSLFHRCLTVAGIAGALLAIAILLAPIRHPVITQATQLPARFARLIIDPVDPPRPLPIVPHHPDPNNANPGGGGGGGHAGELAAPAPVAVVAGGGLRDRAPAPSTPGAGAAGRARAQQEVDRALGGAGGALNSALDGLSASLGSVDAMPASSGGGTREHVVRSVRSDEQVVGSGRGGGGTSIGGGGSADLGRSVVVGSLVGMGGTGTGGGGGGTGGGYGGGNGTGFGNGTGPGSGGGSGGGDGGGTGVGYGSGSGAGGRMVAAPGVYRSNASLLAVIQKYSAGIQYCYGNELKHDATLRGKLVVAITVAASGEVLQATVVQNSVGSARMTECALSQIRSWRFPVIPQGVTAFQAPFVFTPPS